MARSLPRCALVGLLALALCVPSRDLGESSASSQAGGCRNGYATRRELAHGRIFDKRWELAFFRDRRGRPCLTDSWARYGSIFRFRVREHRPRLGILHLAATSQRRRSVYVIDGYVTERVARMKFRIDGRTREVRIVRSPRWTRLPKDLFVHFVGGRRYDHYATGRLRAFGPRGRLLATSVLRRGQFYPSAEPQ